MKTQPAAPVASASFDGMTNWHDLDWARIQQTVRKTQLKIAQATGEGDWRRVKRLQRLLTHSFYGRCLAVRRVTENRGRKTPGVDGETWGTPQAKLQAVGRLSKKRGYRPKPLRRVWIPKAGKPEKRPLGIPTMLDLLEDEVKSWVEQFLSVRGVALSQAKTQITHINQGFDFLGWNFRKYVPKSPYRKAKLLIKPSKKNASAFYRKVREIIKNSGALTQDALIGQLNPVLKGWAQYHSLVVAKQTFSKLDSLIFWRLWRWAKRRHSKKSADWIRNKYFRSIGGQNWVFAYPYKNGKGERHYRQLYKLAETAIVRHKRLPGEYQPYDAAHELKWEALRVQRMQHKLRYRGQILSIFRRQKGVCALCGHAISKETGWHDHHVIRRLDGGPDTLSNRVLLHPNCHALVHSRREKVTLRYGGLEC